MIPEFHDWLRALLVPQSATGSHQRASLPAISDAQLSMHMDNWRQQQIRPIQQFSDVASLSEALNHGTGHIRAAALERSAHWRHADLLPLVLIRLNDWVPQVREAALRTLESYLDQGDPVISAKLVSLLPEIAALSLRQRTDHQPTQIKLESYLQRPANRHLLVAGLRDNEARCARYCFRLLQSASALPMTELADLALKRKDAVLTSDVLNACKALDPGAQDAISRQLLHSPFNTARAAALLAILRSDQTDKASVVNALLFDRTALVREVIWHWHVRSGTDPLAPYRAVWTLPNPGNKQIRCAIWAAVKANARDLLPAIRNLCDSPVATLRGLARLTVAHFEPQAVPGLMLQALHDPAPAANRQAAQLSIRFQVPLPVEVLSDMCNSVNGAQRVLKLMHYAEKWDFLLYLLLIERQHGNLFHAEIQDRLNTWVLLDHKDYHPPQAAQRQQLMALLRARLLPAPAGTTASTMLGLPARLQFILQCNQLLP